MSKPKWFTDHLDTIASLLREGKTAGYIAKLYGVSRGAVVGIVYRNPTLKEIGFRSPAPFIRYVDTTGRAIIRRRLVAMHNDPEIIGLATVRKEKTLMELSSAMCRFPVWGHHEHPAEYLFCAEARTEDSSYCPAHKKLCRNHLKGAHA